ncbi:MAG: hypothetical protein QOD56_3168, partial [Gammaproteobacteria bacterium]|nr:hypothetical protein [Gammaproteobacteria bacterium]
DDGLIEIADLDVHTPIRIGNRTQIS